MLTSCQLKVFSQWVGVFCSQDRERANTLKTFRTGLMKPVGECESFSALCTFSGFLSLKFLPHWGSLSGSSGLALFFCWTAYSYDIPWVLDEWNGMAVNGVGLTLGLAGAIFAQVSYQVGLCFF